MSVLTTSDKIMILMALTKATSLEPILQTTHWNLSSLLLQLSMYSNITNYASKKVIRGNNYKSSAIAEMGDRLATIGMGRKWGKAAVGGWDPMGEEELGPYVTQCGQGRGLPACQVSSWSVQPFGHSARTSQTDRTGQTGQYRQTDRQRSDSIGRTVLQTVAQNDWNYVILERQY